MKIIFWSGWFVFFTLSPLLDILYLFSWFIFCFKTSHFTVLLFQKSLDITFFPPPPPPMLSSPECHCFPCYNKPFLQFYNWFVLGAVLLPLCFIVNFLKVFTQRYFLKSFRDIYSETGHFIHGNSFVFLKMFFVFLF